MARILVIDDEDLARFTIKDFLENAGHEVVEARDGEEGVHFQKAQPFDLIVTDIIMPKKEGVETIIEIKRDFPEIKIIAISGGGRTRNLDFLELANKFGADRVLAKPFTELELIEHVEACLKEIAHWRIDQERQN